MSNAEQACINPIESQRESALKHYQEASSAISHWSGFVEAAIKSYNPPPPGGNTPASEGYWVEIPITKLPEKDGWYVLVAHGAIELVRWYDSVNGWDIPEAEYGYKHYLIRSQSPPSLQEREKGIKWVKASERLPDETAFEDGDKWKLCATNFGGIILSLCYYDHADKKWYGATNVQPEERVAYWMNLIEPSNESEDTAKQSK